MPDVGAPDERQHANYVRYLLKNHSLPIFDPKAADIGEEYQSHQPPLFYGLASGVATVTGQQDVESHSFGSTIRIFNCLVGAFGVVGVFFACFWSTKREEIGLIGAAFAAFLPMNCALSGAISNDPLLIAFISWSFAFCAKALESEESKKSLKPLIIAAIFAGLACLTKSSGLVAVVGLATTALFLRKEFAITKLAGVFGIAILIALPIWLRNTSLYGDPLAQKAFKEAFVNSAQKTTIIAVIEASGAPGSSEVQYWLNWVGYWTARSYIGVFGYMDIWLNASGKAGLSSDPNWLYKAIIGFIALAKISFLVYLRNRWKEVPKIVLVGLIVALITVLLFIGFNLTYFQAQGRYLLPALAPSALILALGWTYVFKAKTTPVLIAVILVFGGTSLYALNQLTPEFALRTAGTMSPNQ